MKKSFLFVATLFLTTTLAQSTLDSKAVALFNKTKAAHGGAALEGMKSYRDTGTYTVYQEGQVAAVVEATQTYDFVGNRARLDIFFDKQLVQIQQATPDEAWQWTAQSGVVKLPAAQAKPIRDSFYQSLFAFRATEKDLEQASSEGTVELRDGIKGESFTITIKGVKSNFVVDANGVVVGTKEGTTIGLLGDTRAVGEIRVPFLAQSFTDDKPFIKVELQKAELNPSLNDDLFAKPK